MRISHRVVAGLALGIALGFGTLAAIGLAPRLGSQSAPEEVAQAYFMNTYTRNYSDAWDRLSSTDQLVRTRTEFLELNPIPSTAQAVMLDQLAQWGAFETLAIVSNDPSRAVVSAHIRFPDLAQPEIEELLVAGAELSIEESNLMQQLHQLNEANQLQYTDEVVSYDLVSEGNRWRIEQKWGHTISVQLQAALSDDLPWQFYAMQSDITAMPGEVVTASYIARNNSADSVTAKAIHEVDPLEAARYFETIECFCFTEQTLASGEEREMVLRFTIDPLIPRDVADLVNRYTFYSLESFPSD